MTFIKKNIKPICSLALALVMFAFIMLKKSDATTAVAFSAIYLGALCAVAFDKKLSLPFFLISAAISAALIYLRVCMLPHVTGDYAYGFDVWMDEIAGYEGLEGIAATSANYNTPYIFILWLIVKSGLDRMIVLKAVSCAFDVLLAYYFMRIIEIKTDKSEIKIIALAAALAIPTVLLNGAYWGQCDSIFAAFAVASLYYGLREKSALCILFFSLSFIIKLHPVFMLVGFAALVMNKKLKLKYLWILPAVYVAAQLPMILAGRNVFEALALPFTGINGMTYGRLWLNAPTFWALLDGFEYEVFSEAGLYLAGAAVLAFGVYVYSIRKRIDTAEKYLLVFYLSTMIMTYFLPSMHERYYIISEVISVAIVFFNKKLWYIPFITVMGSLLAYLPYLTGNTPVSFTVLSAAFALVIILSAIKLNSEVKIKVER